MDMIIGKIAAAKQAFQDWTCLERWEGDDAQINNEIDTKAVEE